MSLEVNGPSLTAALTTMAGMAVTGLIGHSEGLPETAMWPTVVATLTPAVTCWFAGKKDGRK